MKSKVFISALAVVIACFPEPAEAQFFKKLGKALEQVEKKVDKVLGTGAEAGTAEGDAAGTVAPDGTTVSNNLKGFAVDYKGVTWQEDFCGLDFVITNKGDKTVRVYSFDKMKAFGADGAEYAGRSIVGNAVTSLGNGDFDFEPGVPVKCVYALFDVPGQGTKMSLCQLRLTTFDNGYHDSFVEFRNVPLPPRPATVSTPFKGVWTLGGTNLEGKLILDFPGKSVDGMDALSNGIKCYGTVYVGYGSGASLEVDECSIISWKGEGNKATVEFVGGRDGNTYQAVMTYAPSDGTISFSEIRIAREEGMAECFVSEDLVFEK